MAQVSRYSVGAAAAAATTLSGCFASNSGDMDRHYMLLAETIYKDDNAIEHLLKPGAERETVTPARQPWEDEVALARPITQSAAEPFVKSDLSHLADAKVEINADIADIVGVAAKIGLAPGEAERMPPEVLGRLSMTAIDFEEAEIFKDAGDLGAFAAQREERDTRMMRAMSQGSFVEVDPLNEADAGERLTFDYALSIAGAGAGLDLDVEPRARLLTGGDVSGAGAGALVRLGQNFSEPRRRWQIPGWYVFAGADAQALTWKIDRRMGPEDALRFEEKMMVGDAQAGVAFRVGLADIAFGFVHREISHKEATRQEQFGGVTIVVNR